jgi:hypothetical protein
LRQPLLVKGEASINVLIAVPKVSALMAPTGHRRHGDTARG